MKTIATFFSTVAIAAATKEHNPGVARSLTPRQEFCGTDIFGYNWFCDNTIAQCCSGTDIVGCMPLGANCCSTGYWCPSTQECYLNLVTLTQYCTTADGDEETASSGDEELTTSEGSSDGGNDSDSNSNSDGGSDSSNVPDAATKHGMSIWAIVAIAGGAVALL